MEAQSPQVLSVDEADKYTSCYMIGRVTVGIILMESNGSDENWTDEQEEITINEIVQSLDYLAYAANQNGVNLTWFYEVHYRVPTSYEPIQGRAVPYYVYFPYPHTEFEWMNDALSHLGCSDGYEGMYQYCNRLRSQYQTDWAYMTFVVMDSNDTDHLFSEEGLWFAYSQLEGPYVVMTYNNYNWSPAGMYIVFDHETGHIFGAADEYIPGGCNEYDCLETYGYLDVPNMNCKACNENSVPCIMRGNGQWEDFCYYSKGQIGWRDSDGDGPSDPIDPNSHQYANIPDSEHQLQPGDLIRIYTVAADFVKSISVTPDNSMCCNPYGSYVTTWDGSTKTGGLVSVPQTFVAKINDGQEYAFVCFGTQLTTPVFSDIHFDNGVLHWRLNDCQAYVRLKIYDSGDELALYPIRDKVHWSGRNYGTDIFSLVEGASYHAQFFGWLPQGNRSDTTEYSFVYHGPVVLSPNGGEQWEARSIHDVIWNFPRFLGSLKVQYSTDGGASWETIVSSTPNDGVYSWTLPPSAITLSNCKVKVSDASDGVPWDLSDNSFSITPGPLYAPTDLSTSTSWGYGIRLQWTDNNINELGYKIERKDGTNLIWEEIISTGPNANWYHDTANIVGSETYWYRIRAYNETRYSPYSEEQWVRNIPSPPSNLTGNLLCGNSNLLFLSWEPPENQKLPIEFYDLYATDLYKKDCERYFRIYGLADTLCLDHNLDPESKYTIIVQGWDTAGMQGLGAEIEIVPGPIEQCSPELCQGSEFEIFWSYIPGDANGDGSVNLGDIVFLNRYIFSGGPPPCIPESGDANGDCKLNLGDIVYLISYVYKGGPPPKIGCWHGKK